MYVANKQVSSHGVNNSRFGEMKTTNYEHTKG